MRLLRSIATLAMMAVSLAAFPNAGPAAAQETLAGKTVYILTLTPSCDTCATFATVATDAIKKEGANVITEYVNFGAAAEQTQQLNRALSTNPAAILIWPTDQTSLLPALARAKQTNPSVPIVISIYPPDTKDDTLYTAFFGADEAKGGAAQADSLVAGLTAMGKPVEGSVIQIMGALGGYTTTARQRGFEEGLAKVAPGLKIVESQTANWDLSQAQTVATAMFSKYANDKIVGVYAHSDLMLQGGILAAERAGLKAGTDFVALGFDCDPIGVANIKEGKEYATMLWDPVAFGVMGAELTVALAQGKTVEKTTIIDSPKIMSNNTDVCDGATIKK